MQAILHRFLTSFIRTGTLTVTWPNASQTSYGTTPPTAAVAFTTPSAVRRFLLDPSLALGELYMEGTLRPQGCEIHAVVDLIGTNLTPAPYAYPGLKAAALFARARRRLDQRNPQSRSRRNVAHHYDLDARLYALFLDPDRQYSCAYFATGEESLAAAQSAKKHHIAAKLKLDRPGLRVLDIGSGWGGLALTLAQDYGCTVDGITLSTEQLEAATARAAAANLSQRVRFHLCDYRDIGQTYDRIVSVGMFEHVGLTHYEAYFTTIARALAPDGVALLHTIGRTDAPASTNRWIAKYIFPGGYSPAMSEVLPHIEQSNLILTDVEVLRLHYAHTIAHWRANFAAHRAQITTLYDERFARMFEFYLSLSEMAFRRLTHVNFQFQLTHRNDTLPLTRTYMLNK